MTARLHGRRALFVSLVAITAASALAYLASAGGVGTGSTAQNPDVVIGHMNYAFDPRDDRRLAGAASDIFVGRVVAQSGTVGAPTSMPGQEVPQTQFAVEVLQAVKGTAAGTVTVNQVGGWDGLTGQLFLLEGDPLLRPGDEALFVVLWVPEHGWYQVLADGHGHPRARGGAERARVVERFARAAGVQVPRDADPRATQAAR